MSIERMADRTLPLAERVKEAVRSGMNAQAGDERFLPVLDALDGLDGLLDDIAAADRLARADVGYWDWVGGDSCEWGVSEEHVAALAAYRARMAQGVGDGE